MHAKRCISPLDEYSAEDAEKRIVLPLCGSKHGVFRYLLSSSARNA